MIGRLLLIVTLTITATVVGVASNSFWAWAGCLLVGGFLLAVFAADADV